MKQWISAALVSGMMMACAAQAGEAEVRKAVQTLAPGTKISQIGKAPVAGWYEVVIEDARQGPTVLYVNEKGVHAFTGDLIDLARERNLTQERMEELTRVKFDSLPLDQALKVVKGKGQRQLVIFSDPDCPFCRKLEKELAKIDNVTLYNFIYPVAHPKAADKARQIWCAADRARAWTDYMLNQKLAENKGDCANFIEQNMALGRKLRVDGTPTLIFQNGRRVPGFIPAERIEALLK